MIGPKEGWLAAEDRSVIASAGRRGKERREGRAARQMYFQEEAKITRPKEGPAPAPPREEGAPARRGASRGGDGIGIRIRMDYMGWV